MATVLPPSPARPAAALPESDQLYEIVDGVRTEKTVNAYASWIATRLDRSLGTFVDEHGTGTSVMELVFILDKDRNLRRRPDIAFISTAKWPVVEPPPLEGDWDVIPDLAVEVISPSNTFEEVLRKLREYFAYGVVEVWIVSPKERLIQVYRSMEDVTIVRARDTLTSPILPGWSVPVETLLPRVVREADAIDDHR